MYKIGNIFEIFYKGKTTAYAMLVQTGSDIVCLIDLPSGNRYHEPTQVKDSWNVLDIEMKTLVCNPIDFTYKLYAKNMEEFVEKQISQKRTHSIEQAIPQKTYSINDTIIISQSGYYEYKIIPLEIDNKKYIVLINKSSFTRWEDPVEVGDWKCITQEEMEEIIGSNNFYKKEK